MGLKMKFFDCTLLLLSHASHNLKANEPYGKPGRTKAPHYIHSHRDDILRRGLMFRPTLFKEKKQKIKKRNLVEGRVRNIISTVKVKAKGNEKDRIFQKIINSRIKICRWLLKVTQTRNNEADKKATIVGKSD